MNKYVRYNPTKTYIDPTGRPDTPERVQNEKCPGVLVDSYVVLTDESEKMSFGYMHLGSLRSRHNISQDLTEDEAIEALTTVLNAPQELPVPDGQERLAAAQEYQNMKQYGTVSAGVMALNADNGLWSSPMVQEGIVVAAKVLTDDQSIAFKPYLKEWQDVLNDGGSFVKDEPFNHNGLTYRAVIAVTPQAHQKPDGIGMLAVYRPIDEEHEGTIGDPYQYLAGMDVEKDKYYYYNGLLYKATQDIPACHAGWAPGTSGVHFWELVG